MTNIEPDAIPTIGWICVTIDPDSCGVVESTAGRWVTRTDEEGDVTSKSDRSRSFLKVDEPTSKNRMHLDLRVKNSAVARIPRQRDLRNTDRAG